MHGSELYYPDEKYIRNIVSTHFHNEMGSRYWLEQKSNNMTNIVENVKSFSDFKKIAGFRDAQEQRKFEESTRFRPLEDFIPQKILRSGRGLWASQTGGTTGAPKHGCWDSYYWGKILEFSDEFLDLHRVPRNANWLFMGPTGPHTTGRLIISITENRGGRCFTIDLDPRIVKIFGAENMSEAYERYIRHIWDQVESIIKYQNIDVIFSTSKLLEMMPQYINMKLVRNIQGIVHAGTSMSNDTNLLLSEKYFPQVPIVGIYGTSTTGISFQKPREADDKFRIVYIPSSPYIVIEIVDDEGDLVDYGNSGHVSTYRLTEDYIIPGFWERDLATRIKPYGRYADTYPWDWIEGVYSPDFISGISVEGVY